MMLAYNNNNSIAERGVVDAGDGRQGARTLATIRTAAATCTPVQRHGLARGGRTDTDNRRLR